MGLEGRALVPLQSFQPLASCRCSVIKLELCVCACEPALGHSLALCWDHIKDSTHTKQLDNCLQKKCTIFLHIILHILHIVVHTAAYYLTYSAYCAYCNMQNKQNLNSALFFCILFGIFCILFCILQHIIWHIHLESYTPVQERANSYVPVRTSTYQYIQVYTSTGFLEKYVLVRTGTYN